MTCLGTTAERQATQERIDRALAGLLKKRAVTRQDYERIAHDQVLRSSPYNSFYTSWHGTRVAAEQHFKGRTGKEQEADRDLVVYEAQIIPDGRVVLIDYDRIYEECQKDPQWKKRFEEITGVTAPEARAVARFLA